MAATKSSGPMKRQNQQASRGFPDDGVIRVSRERRRASSVTMIHGLAPHEIDAVGTSLRKLCGTGGTAKNGIVELQGDHRDRVVAWFEEQKRRVKRAGG
jgi:translation initiation factor 1